MSRPSDVQQCGEAADQGAEGDAGPSRPASCDNQPRRGASSTTKGSKRSAEERSEATTRLQAAVRRLKGVTPQKKQNKAT